MNCASVRRSFPDMAAGLSDAAAQTHLASCRACQSELSAFRSALDAATVFADDDVPDPGADYWDQFLPSVRARLASRQHEMPPRARISLPAAAAALIMIGVTIGALFLARPAGLSNGPLVEAGSRLEKALLDRPGLVPEIAADMLGADPVLALDAAQVLAVMEETDQPAGLAGDWADESLRAIIDELTREQTARLRAELESDQG